MRFENAVPIQVLILILFSCKGASRGGCALAARTIDDQVIIVVEDSETGEVRVCGDLTGYCIGMNPWKKGLTPAQNAPISLIEHVPPPQPERKRGGK